MVNGSVHYAIYFLMNEVYTGSDCKVFVLVSDSLNQCKPFFSGFRLPGMPHRSHQSGKSGGHFMVWCDPSWKSGLGSTETFGEKLMNPCHYCSDLRKHLWDPLYFYKKQKYLGLSQTTTDERELVRPFLVDAQSFCIRTRHICIFSLSVVTDHDSSGLFTIQLNSYILTMFGYSSWVRG